MAEWSLYYYVEPSGRSPFEEWLLELPEDARGHIVAKMDYLEQVRAPNKNLVDGYKSMPGLLEFKPTFKKRQYRPLMCRHPRVEKGFVFLEGAVEENWKIKKSHLEAADRRRKNLFEDPARAKLRE